MNRYLIMISLISVLCLGMIVSFGTNPFQSTCDYTDKELLEKNRQHIKDIADRLNNLAEEK